MPDTFVMLVRDRRLTTLCECVIAAPDFLLASALAGLSSTSPKLISEMRVGQLVLYIIHQISCFSLHRIHKEVVRDYEHRPRQYVTSDLTSADLCPFQTNSIMHDRLVARSALAPGSARAGLRFFNCAFDADLRPMREL